MARNLKADQQLTALREQQIFEGAQRRARNERILKVARDNPEMGIEELSERFGMSIERMEQRLSRAGVKRGVRAAPPLLRSEARSAKAPQGTFDLGWRRRA